LGPAARLLVGVMGPDVEVAVVAEAVARLVVEVPFCVDDDAADLLEGGRAGACVADVAGRAALVVVDVSNVVAVDGLTGTGLAVADVVESAGATAAGSSVPLPPPQAQPTTTRTTPRAAQRKRMATNVTLDRHRYPTAGRIPSVLHDAPLAFAFGSGMLAAFNPCGFALLPAYLGWFLGLGTGRDGAGGVERTGVGRCLLVGGCVTIGFVAVFAAFGVLVRQFSVSIGAFAPYLTLGLGILMIPFGLFLLSGRQIKLRLPTVGHGPQDRTLPAVLLFGASYAAVSLGCTLPNFLGPIASTLGRDLTAGIATFAAYSAGIALILIPLTLAVGLAKGQLVRHFRRVLPHVGRASGALLTLTGGYVAYYGWYEVEILVRDNPDVRVGPIDWVTARTDDLATWVIETGPTRLGLILFGLLAFAVVATAVLRRRRLVER
jgi:cytochrome c-type biogenesis protein